MPDETRCFTLQVNFSEFAMILAALRLVQDLRYDDELGWTSYISGMPHFTEIKPIEDYEIDILCERINAGTDSLRLPDDRIAGRPETPG